MKVVLLGATRGMGLALARCMARRGDALYLLGRDAGALDRAASDLEGLGGRKVAYGPCDLSTGASAVAGALDAAQEALPDFDTVIVTASLFDTQEHLERDRDLRDGLLTTNFSNTIHFCEEARRRLLARGGGTLCVFSSVAALRARKQVVLYGATKAGLSYYLDGLDLRYRGAGLKTVTVIPGFIRTDMTAGLDVPPFAADPEDVAPAILRAIDRGKRRVVVPGIWWLVMLVIRYLPRFVMRRATF